MKCLSNDSTIRNIGKREAKPENLTEDERPRTNREMEETQRMQAPVEN